MPSFSVLKLPYLARAHVLKVMSGEDLLVFSFISKRSKNLAIAARRSITSFKWELCSQSRINFLDYCLCHILRIGMDNQLKEEAIQSGSLEFWKLNGQLIPVYRKTEFSILCTWYIGELADSEEHNYQMMVQYSDHVLQVFQCDNFDYTTSNPDPPQDLFVLKHTRRFKKLALVDFDPMPADHLKFVLEELEVESFTINRSVSDFHWDGPLRMEELCVHRPTWLAFEAILNCECKSLDFNMAFTDAEFHRFIKKWLNGGLKNLEYIHVTPSARSFAVIVLQGIQTIPYDPDRHPEGHPRDRNDDFDEHQEFAVDIRRSDGVLATVLIHPNGVKFVMGVWNDA